jgi:hypothetical protein
MRVIWGGGYMCVIWGGGYVVTGGEKECHLRRRIHVCHKRRRIHVCHMGRRIHVCHMGRRIRCLSTTVTGGEKETSRRDKGHDSSIII